MEKKGLKDIQKFALALDEYIQETQGCTKEERNEKYRLFQTKIQVLKCEDFRFHYHRARFLNNQKDNVNEAKAHIDKSIKLLNHIQDDPIQVEENGYFLFLPPVEGQYFHVPLPSIKVQKGDIYFLAGEIYAKIGMQTSSLEYYKKSFYYKSFLKSEFEEKDTITVFSFRKFNQFSLADLINNEITVSPSTCMNDPFDSLINLWGDEKHLQKTCNELLHIKPLHDAFNFYRIRCFCIGKGNKPVKNILMWSHYADEHRGFCIKYKLSNHFYKEDETNENRHMYLKRINYENVKFDLSAKSIDSNLAFATKKKDWKYENEARLIVYDMNAKAPHYGIPLDTRSKIEAIYFGYLCPQSTIKTIKNIFADRKTKLPKLYKMMLNTQDVYNLQIGKFYPI